MQEVGADENDEQMDDEDIGSQYEGEPNQMDYGSQVDDEEDIGDGGEDDDS